MENVSILYASLVDFDEHYKACTQPQEMISLLSRLYSKFDNLCEQYGVYKVHMLGDTYVVMGYKGKIAREKRTMDDAVNEAYNLLQVGHQMAYILKEERERLKDLSLQNVEVRVGISTGKIVGCIIGTKVVRYDIFG